MLCRRRSWALLPPPPIAMQYLPDRCLPGEARSGPRSGQRLGKTTPGNDREGGGPKLPKSALRLAAGRFDSGPRHLPGCAASPGCVLGLRSTQYDFRPASLPGGRLARQIGDDDAGNATASRRPARSSRSRCAAAGWATAGSSTTRTEIVRNHASSLWITCALSFSGWREQWQPHHYTVLFFHDEAVSLPPGIVRARYAGARTTTPTAMLSPTDHAKRLSAKEIDTGGCTPSDSSLARAPGGSTSSVGRRPRRGVRHARRIALSSSPATRLTQVDARGLRRSPIPAHSGKCQRRSRRPRRWPRCAPAIPVQIAI